MMDERNANIDDDGVMGWFDVGPYAARLAAGNIDPNYAHTYDGVLALFKMLATTPRRLSIVGAPEVWRPLLLTMGHDIANGDRYVWTFPEDKLDWVSYYRNAPDSRAALEHACSCRPELVDALYQWDTEWRHTTTVGYPTVAWRPTGLRVTCNSSFFRPEILAYLGTTLPEWVAQKAHQPWSYGTPDSVAIIVPCAAAKPYPAPMHTAVIDAAKRATKAPFELFVATGVLGVIPQTLWGEAPEYDSGLPNSQRVQEVVARVFQRIGPRYRGIVVYSDFYAVDIAAGLTAAGVPGDRVRYVFPPVRRDRYENLMDSRNLAQLEQTIAGVA